MSDSNIDKLEDQIEYQHATLTCYWCDKEKIEYDDWVLATNADKQGWKVIRGYVNCPSCVKKKNKKRK